VGSGVFLLPGPTEPGVGPDAAASSLALRIRVGHGGGPAPRAAVGDAEENKILSLPRW